MCVLYVLFVLYVMYVCTHIECVWHRVACLGFLLALEVRPGEGLHGGEQADLAHPSGQRHRPALLHPLHGHGGGGGLLARGGALGG